MYMCVYTGVCVHLYERTYVHVYMHVYSCLCTYVCVCMCTVDVCDYLYVYIYISLQNYSCFEIKVITGMSLFFCVACIQRLTMYSI